MMRAILLFLTLLLLPAPQGNSSSQVLRMGAGSPCVNYTGPGDIASATAWYGFRGYSCTASQGSTKSAQLRRASDNTTQDINILLGGDFDTSSANTFAGTDATCNASISGTTMTLQSGACTGGTLHAGDTLTGTGLTQPVYIQTIGTCGSNTSGNTCTLSSSQGTIATETITAQVGLFVKIMYDQTAGNACTGSTSCDLTNVTGGSNSNQPLFLPTCVNSKPCMVTTTFSQGIFAANTLTPNAANTASLAVVAQRKSGTNTVQIVEENALHNRIEANAANVWSLKGGTSGTLASTGTTAADAAWHTGVGVGNGASSVLNVDGTEFTGTVTNDHTAGAPQMAISNTSTFLYAAEVGIWDNQAFDSTKRTNICHNSAVYYGTTQGSSC